MLNIVRHALKRRTIRKYYSRLTKQLHYIGARNPDTQAIFILGLQRSGTTMMQYVLDLSRQTWVFHERSDNKIYKNFHLADLEAVIQSLHTSGAQYCVYKPLADSHKVLEFIDVFPDCKILWMYRSFRDSARSWARRWPNSPRVIDLVFAPNQQHQSIDDPELLRFCAWLKECTSDVTRNKIESLLRPDVSDYDRLCLLWYARNRLVIEKDLGSKQNVLLLEYESLVHNKHDQFSRVFDYLNLTFDSRMVTDVHTDAVNNSPVTPSDSKINNACEELKSQLLAASRGRLHQTLLPTICQALATLFAVSNMLEMI